MNACLSTRTMGENKGPNATCERDTSFVRNSEKNMEVKGNKASKSVLPLSNAEKNTPLITSLKRKTTEVFLPNIDYYDEFINTFYKI